jgi:hypothetical protein
VASVGNTAAYVPPSSTSSLSASLTLGSATKRKVVVKLVAETLTTTPTDVTFDGVSMVANSVGSNPDQHSTATSLRQWEWWHDVPIGTSSGGKTLTVTLGASSSLFSWHAWELVDCADGAPESTQFAQGTGAAATASVTSTSDAALVAVGLIAAATQTITVSGDLSERFENNEANYTSASADVSTVATGTRSVTMTPSTGSDTTVRLSSYAAASVAPPTPAFGRYGVRGPIR